MWGLENHCRERGRSFGNKPSVHKEYSCSPPRTPRTPLHTPRGFIVHSTPGAYDHDSYFSLPVTLAADNDTADNTNSRPTNEPHLAVPSEQANDKIAFDTRVVELNVLELWRAFEKTVLSDNDSTSSTVAEPALPCANPVTPAAQVPYDLNSKQSVAEVSYHSFDEPYIFDTAIAPPTSRETTHSKPTPYPKANTKRTSKATTCSPVNPQESMYHNARNTSVRFLSKLLDSPKINIISEATGEVYVKDGIIRVIRYMRRWCINPSNRPTGELRTPPSSKESIATYLACRLFRLGADAQHMQNLVVEDFMGSPRFFITDEDVGLIWCHYEGTLRDTLFGDAIVWFLLECVMGGTHALADKMRWMLEQEEYEDLKARVRYELKKAKRTALGRKAYLRRCLKEREEREDESFESAPGNNRSTQDEGSDMDKRLPATS